jgi:hypothetical protein
MRKRLGWCLLSATILAFAIPTIVEAQPRDAGAKMRGDVGRTSGRATYSRGVVPRPALSVDRSYQAFSVEPLPFQAGDDVRVVGERANLMLGRRVVGHVTDGETLRVLQIRGPWVGTVANVDGKEVAGWIWYSQVAELEG